MQLLQKPAFPLLSYLLFSALYTWPALRMDASVLVTRHFDLYPSLWLFEASPGKNLFWSGSAWPYGEQLTRVDSYVWLFLSWINHVFLDDGLLTGVQAANLLLLLGPVVNGMAAEWCTHRVFGVERPFSWLAGLVYGFSGIASVAMLEGHVYYLLNPWLPLLLGVFWRGGGWKEGLLGGIYWSLCLFTTAYIGICGAILVGALGWRSFRILPGFLVVAIPTSLYYLWLFSMGGSWKDNAPTMLAMGTNGISLVGLLYGPESVDIGGHSLVTPLAFFAFFLWFWSFSEKEIRGLWVLSFCVLVASFGDFFRVFPAELGTALAFFRFPMRLMWLYTLLSGVLASHLLRKWRWGDSWMGVALVDVLVSSGMPWRQGNGIAEVPSVYSEAAMDRAVLDVFGESLDQSSGELEMRVRALSCYYAAHHRRPVPEVCMGTGLSSPRETIQKWLVHQADQGSLLLPTFQGLGIGAVVLHLQTLREADALFLSNALQREFGAPLVSSDGGERLFLYRIPSGSMERAREKMRSLVF